MCSGEYGLCAVVSMCSVVWGGMQCKDTICMMKDTARWMDELFQTGMLHPQEWVFMQVLNNVGTTQVHTYTHRQINAE